jgi:hypothetical protein
MRIFKEFQHEVEFICGAKRTKRPLNKNRLSMDEDNVQRHEFQTIVRRLEELERITLRDFMPDIQPRNYEVVKTNPHSNGPQTTFSFNNGRGALEKYNELWPHATLYLVDNQGRGHQFKP